MCSDTGNRGPSRSCRNLRQPCPRMPNSCGHCGTVPPLLWGGNARWGPLLGVAACVCVLAIPAAAGAGHSPNVAALQADDAGLAAKSRAAVLDLYSLDTRLTTARGRLASLQAARARLEAEGAALHQALKVAILGTRVSQIRLASRLRFIYEHGTTGSLDIFMGAKSLEDALTQLDDYDRVSAADAHVLLQVRSAKRHTVELQHDLATRARTLAATTAAAATTVSELEHVRADRATYIAELARRRSLDAARIAQISAEATAADSKSQQLSPAPRAPNANVPAPVTSVVLTRPTGGRTLTVVATGYDLPGPTATGLPVGWGIAAVDPSVIPLGTRIVVPGYGIAVAADTGVYGASIDLWFPTAAQALAWGRHTITIALH
jgi:3D (Asp-Asp-Asp) domain-containing protein/peptidoglycan hydrolase CwlO-like protein